MWNKQEHDFGKVTEGQILTTDFLYLGDKQIKEIEPKCSCTNYTLENNKLTVNWKIREKQQSRFVLTYLTIVYSDDNITDLTLSANVYYT